MWLINSFNPSVTLFLPLFYGAAKSKQIELVLLVIKETILQRFMASSTISKLNNCSKRYGNFNEWVDFAFWWSCIEKGFRLQPAQQGCFYKYCNILRQKRCLVTNLMSAGRPFFNDLNTGIARKGGGVNPCQMCFEHFFMVLDIWAKWRKGEGAMPCKQIRITFKGFILLNSIKNILIGGKCPKGRGACQKYWIIFFSFSPTNLDFLKCLKKEWCLKH